jgi:hypothetical protein
MLRFIVDLKDNKSENEFRVTDGTVLCASALTGVSPEETRGATEVLPGE